MRKNKNRKRTRLLLISLIAVFGAISLWKGLPRPARPAGISEFRMAAQQEITPLPTPTDLPPTPTETLPPTQELPTPALNLPALESWVGAPTYAVESKPGYSFRVDFDPEVWALTVDEMGNTALVHRQISYCKMIPTSGRGTPRGWMVDDQFRDIGTIRFEVVTASQNGVVQFVNYFGSDGVILSGFQVSAQDQQQECLQAAETVLATLSSVMALPATRTPTPTPTATLTPIP